MGNSLGGAVALQLLALATSASGYLWFLSAARASVPKSIRFLRLVAVPVIGRLATAVHPPAQCPDHRTDDICGPLAG